MTTIEYYSHNTAETSLMARKASNNFVYIPNARKMSNPFTCFENETNKYDTFGNACSSFDRNLVPAILQITKVHE